MKPRPICPLELMSMAGSKAIGIGAEADRGQCSGCRPPSEKRGCRRSRRSRTIERRARPSKKKLNVAPVPVPPVTAPVIPERSRIAAWVGNGDRGDAAASADRGDRQGGRCRKRAAGNCQCIADGVTGASRGGTPLLHWTAADARAGRADRNRVRGNNGVIVFPGFQNSVAGVERRITARVARRHRRHRRHRQSPQCCQG